MSITKKTFPIHLAYRETYLPTKRHKIYRDHFQEETVDIDFEERDEADFPVAGMIRENKFGDEDTKTVLRYARGKLWKKSRYTLNTPTTKGELSIRAFLDRNVYNYGLCIAGSIHDECQGWDPQESIIGDNDREEVTSKAKENASKLIYFDGEFWEIAGEPYYMADVKSNCMGVLVDVAFTYLGENTSRITNIHAYAAKDRSLLDAEIAKVKAENPRFDAYFKKEIDVLLPEAFHFGAHAEAAIRENIPRILSQMSGDLLPSIAVDGKPSKLEEYLLDNLGDAIVNAMKKEGRPLYKFSHKDIAKALCNLTGRLLKIRAKKLKK